MNYNYLINEGANQLKKKFIRNPKLDSELLLSSVLNKSREEILLKLNRKVNRYELNKFKLAVRKRQKKMPLAYIIGKKEFWKTEFLINKEVLLRKLVMDICDFANAS